MKAVKVIYDKCIGCGKCYALCPEVFTLDDEGIAIVRTAFDICDNEIDEKIEQAKRVCPTNAIKIKK